MTMGLDRMALPEVYGRKAGRCGWSARKAKKGFWGHGGPNGEARGVCSPAFPFSRTPGACFRRYFSMRLMLQAES